MAVNGTGASGLPGLQSQRSVERMEQISSLRARGISKNIDLPQLVVCGDQSAGKSSVLEGISNIPFPRAEGVCTKFPTEVILEHAEQDRLISASIIPHASRSDKLKSKLQKFHASISEYDELPGVIAKAGELMGLRGYGENHSGPAFAEDVLTIKVVGRTNLHLSIVDLPGLISVASEEQTADDVATVHRMVDTYIGKPRTIILAIVQASNDIANQSIITKSQKVDTAGQRTIGVITKPDLINEGTESRIAALANNQDSTKLKLGFFLLKNPTPAEMQQGLTGEQRSTKERQFFQSRHWSQQHLDPDRLGIDNLRVFLQQLLEKHIEQELPKVATEIEEMIKATNLELQRLPKERPTVADIRTFLSDVAMHYHSLATAALNGEYHTAHADFFVAEGDKIPVTRLRAGIHAQNGGFADKMRDKGQMMKQSSKAVAPPAKHSALDNGTKNLLDSDTSEEEKPKTASSTSADVQSSAKAQALLPKLVSRDDMLGWVRKTLNKTRGPELPGNYNHVLLTELFHHQSKRWPDLAQQHLASIYSRIVDFAKKALAHLNLEHRVRTEIWTRMVVKLRRSRADAEAELGDICADERKQPITYNHYYTDNIQKARTDAITDLVHRSIDNTTLVGRDKAQIKAAMTPQVIVNMNERACSEALDDLNAYYKVASKTFVDNVCRQVLERHIVSNLPKIFSPHDVASYSDAVLEQIAGENSETIKTREDLQEQLEALKAGLDDLSM